MINEYLQLIAYGNQNQIMSNNNTYVLGLAKINMHKNIQKNVCIYSCNSNSTLYMTCGIIFELDDLIMSDINYKEKVYDLVTKFKLNIYTLKKVFDEENKKYIDTDTTYYIGSIPLYLADFKYI